MSSLEATVSMLEVMPEEARAKVLEFTQGLFTSHKPQSPFVPLTKEQVLADLAESRRQIAEGKGMDARQALDEMGRKHGFI